ncbi:hypothetical protein L1887_19960 [Cichorium endivia]|nr:hypothetical protein L1887_19960 [Cichorium endivia]
MIEEAAMAEETAPKDEESVLKEKRRQLSGGGLQLQLIGASTASDDVCLPRAPAIFTASVAAPVHQSSRCVWYQIFSSRLVAWVNVLADYSRPLPPWCDSDHQELLRFPITCQKIRLTLPEHLPKIQLKLPAAAFSDQTPRISVDDRS